MKIQDNIKKLLITNSIITYGCVILVVVMTILNFMNTQSIVKESRAFLYAINPKGEIIPMECYNRMDKKEIEIKHHLQMFVDYFYSFTQTNWKKQAEKALWLADEDLGQIHIDRKNNGYYNRFIQYSIFQKGELNIKDIELDLKSGEPYSFRIIINVIEEYKGVSKKYIVFAKGKIKSVESDRNFPKNPHGLHIYDYIEEHITKVEDEKN